MYHELISSQNCNTIFLILVIATHITDVTNVINHVMCVGS